MVATTMVVVFNGVAPGTTADITNQEIRFKTADDNTVNSSDPVPVPSTGEVFSWRKHTKLWIEGPPDNQIENLRFYSSGTSLGTGIFHYAATTDIYTQGSSADESTKISGGVDSAVYTSGSPLTITPGVVIYTSGTPTFGTQNFVVQQMGVSADAGPGNSGARTFTFRYDES